MTACTPLADEMSRADAAQEPLPAKVPPAVYLLGATIFAITTSEFMVAGMMPSLSAAFDVSIAEVGYLISLFAMGMTVGGPLVTALLLYLRVPNKQALLWLLGLFIGGSILAAIGRSYEAMAVARVVQGVSSAVCFGISLTICADLVRPDLRGRAASIVLAGLMLSPVLGVPATTLIDQTFGWQASFWSIVVLALLSTLIVVRGVPASRADAHVGLAAALAALRNGQLWAAYATSALIIGATFAAFSYFSPIFTEVAGLPVAAIPLLLAAYGAANIVGNLVIGRFADRFTIPILAGGLILLSVALAVFALFATVPAVSVAAFITIGLTGVAMNPAMVARVMHAAHPGPLVNATHSSVITAGLAAGTWVAGLGIDAGYGFTAPLWTGLAFALVGLLSLALPGARALRVRLGSSPATRGCRG